MALTKSEGIFAIFLTVNLIASVLNHIDDTDETYGYWEPLHYLLFGVGLQTWEYAPSFAIRTYSFIYPLSLLSSMFTQLGLSKVLVFRAIKCTLGSFAAYSETQFVCSIATKFGNRIGYITMLFMLLSPGIFFSSTAYLPSAVCMSLLMLSNAAWLRDERIRSILWGCVAVLCTGWPFVGLLFAPLGVHMLYSVYFCGVAKDSNRSVLSGVLAVMVLLAHGIVIVAVIQGLVLLLDYKFYQAWASPTLNILLYNAIGGSGDELYGIEPARYYVLNLLLNMGLAWPLSVVLPVILGVSFLSSKVRSSWSAELAGTGAVLFGQALLWLLVLFSRPHKEERFMYPIYPVLAFAGALSVQTVLQLPEHLLGLSVVGAKRVQKTALVVLTLLGGALCVSRIVSNTANFGGYIRLWERGGEYIHNDQKSMAHGRDVTVCTGGEWYQFPSHFFLPAGARLQFVKDGFTGILPQHFAPQDGTSAEPLQPFNDLNREEKSRYVELGQCDYLVVLLDRNQPVQENVLRSNLLLSEEERKPLSATASFRAVISESVISPDFSPNSLYRAYYVPFKTPESVKFKDYILYKRNLE